MGSRGKPGVQMVGPWWRGVVQPPPNPSTSPVSLSQNVTGDLGRHCHLGLRVLLLSCPHHLSGLGHFQLECLSIRGTWHRAHSPVCQRSVRGLWHTAISPCRPGDPGGADSARPGPPAAFVSFHRRGSYLLGRRPLHTPKSTLQHPSLHPPPTWGGLVTSNPLV